MQRRKANCFKKSDKNLILVFVTLIFFLIYLIEIKTPGLSLSILKSSKKGFTL